MGRHRWAKKHLSRGSPKKGGTLNTPMLPKEGRQKVPPYKSAGEGVPPAHESFYRRRAHSPAPQEGGTWGVPPQKEKGSGATPAQNGANRAKQGPAAFNPPILLSPQRGAKPWSSAAKNTRPPLKKNSAPQPDRDR